MKQISEKAYKLIGNVENILGREDYGLGDEFDYFEAKDALVAYIATLESEVEALRPYRDGFDPQERLPEVNKYEQDTSVNVDALILTSSGVVFWGTPYYHFGKKEWLGIRDNMVILRWYPELPYSESEMRNDDEIEQY